MTWEGIGSGTPFEREKQHAKARAMKAADNVLQHRISKNTAEEKALLVKTPLRHDIKTKYVILNILRPSLDWNVR